MTDEPRLPGEPALRGEPPPADERALGHPSAALPDEAGRAGESARAEAARAAVALGYFGSIVSLLIILPILAFVLWPSGPAARIASLDDPERSLALIAARTMDVHAAVVAASPWERWLYEALGIDEGGDADQLIAWYRELARVVGSPGVELHLAVLEADVGLRKAVRRNVEEWSRREAPYPALALVLRSAYVRSPVGVRPAMLEATVDRFVDPDWFRDRLVAGIGRHTGDVAAVRAAAARSAARSAMMLVRVRIVATVMVLMILGGLVALVLVVRREARDRAQLVIGTATLPPPWPGGVGIAVLLRGAALTAVASVGLILLSTLDVLSPGLDRFVPHLIELLLGVAIAIPVVLLARRYLFAPSGVSPVDALGLRLPSRGVPRLLLVVAAVVVVMFLGDSVIGAVTDRFGITGHWTEWFDEGLAFGPADAVAATLLGAVVLAPLTEEIVFRGILFATLRRRLAWPVAAGVSALAFAALHGYGVTGFASVWWSGFVWAWTYERTRSLWPTIAAHAAGNLWASATVVGLLR